MLSVHIEQGRVSLRQAPRPSPKPGFALIRLILAGICNTDIELLRGYYGFRGRPGHEFVGEVVGPEGSALLGQRVVGEINLACGACDWCARGLGRHCGRRTVLGIVRHPGAFAEYLTLPEANLRAVPRAVPDEHAVFTEPIAAACEILDQVRIPKGAPVAVLGDGKLGLLVAQVLACYGAEVHLYGRHAEKLRIAAAAGCQTHRSGRLPRARFDYTVEATGSAGGLAAAVALTRPRGTVVMKSTVHGAVALDAAPVVVNEITLVGSRCGRFEPALDLLRRNLIPVDEMISEQFPLTDAPRAFECAARKGILKVLLR
ncbi:MAG: alcohol dehydrogenase catalytic domain-containing protein [Bryobacteraceae bacterium]